jgi:TRAP-type C4-dicarboxylate transport system permease large subunit
VAAQAITSITDNPVVLALLLNLFLLVLGCIMTCADHLISRYPAAAGGADRMNPIQFGIIIILNCGIGLLTPPVGSVLFIGSAVGKVPMERVVKATMPFYLCMIVALLLVTFIQPISMLLPTLLR